MARRVSQSALQEMARGPKQCWHAIDNLAEDRHLHASALRRHSLGRPRSCAA